MGPESTLAEVNRILAPGGVFVAYDPTPITSPQVEHAIEGYRRRLSEHWVRLGLRDGLHEWDKTPHLERLRQSGLFRETRESVLVTEDVGSATRVVDLARGTRGYELDLVPVSAVVTTIGSSLRIAVGFFHGHHRPRVIPAAHDAAVLGLAQEDAVFAYDFATATRALHSEVLPDASLVRWLPRIRKRAKCTDEQGAAARLF